MLEELALGRVARERDRIAEMRGGNRVAPAAQLEFAEGRGVERIAIEGFAAANRFNFLDAALRSVALGDGDRTVERDHRRRTDRQQPVVEADELFPVGVLG